jgi:hypothetical protein
MLIGRHPQVDTRLDVIDLGSELRLVLGVVTLLHGVARPGGEPKADEQDRPDPPSPE